MRGSVVTLGIGPVSVRLPVWAFVFVAALAMDAAVLGADRAEVDLNAQVSKLHIGTSTTSAIIQALGKPQGYIWEGRTYTSPDLPAVFIMEYGNGLSLVVVNSRLSEIRVTQPGYLWSGKLQVGSSVEEVFAALGQPARTLEGQSLGRLAQNNTFYKDIDGTDGYCYYSVPAQGLRLFFSEGAVSGIFLTRDAPRAPASAPAAVATPSKRAIVTPVTTGPAAAISSTRAAVTAATTRPVAAAPTTRPTVADRIPVIDLSMPARRFIQCLAAGQFASAGQMLDPAMHQVLTDDQLAATWRDLRAQVGDFQRQGAVRSAKVGEVDVALVACQFARAEVTLRVASNASGQVSGFFVQSVAPRNLTSRADPIPAAGKERPATVGSGQ